MTATATHFFNGISMARSLPSQFFVGLNTPIRGWQFMLRHWKLWAYAWQPVIVSALIAIIVGTLAVWGGMSAVSSLQPAGDAVWWERALAIAAQIGVVIVAVATALTLYIVLQGAFCAVFFSILARQTEMLLGTDPASLKDPTLSAQVIDALRAGLKLMIANLLLLLLNLLPLIGSIVAMTLGAYVDAYVLGAEFIGYPLELRGVRWLHRQQYAKQHLGATLGVGAVVSLFLFVPVLGAVLQATAVVGSVLLYHDWHVVAVVEANEAEPA